MWRWKGQEERREARDESEKVERPAEPQTKSHTELEESDRQTVIRGQK